MRGLEKSGKESYVKYIRLIATHDTILDYKKDIDKIYIYIYKIEKFPLIIQLNDLHGFLKLFMGCIIFIMSNFIYLC